MSGFHGNGYKSKNLRTDREAIYFSSRLQQQYENFDNAKNHYGGEMIHCLSDCLLSELLSRPYLPGSFHQLHRGETFLQDLSGPASQDIPRFLWNRIFLYRVHNTQPVDPIPSQFNPLHTFAPCFNCRDYIVSMETLKWIWRKMSREEYPNKLSWFILLSQHSPVVTEKTTKRLYTTQEAVSMDEMETRIV